MEAVGLETQLCFESVLIGLLVEVKQFSLEAPDGQCSGEYGAPLLKEQPPPPFPGLGVCLQRNCT